MYHLKISRSVAATISVAAFLCSTVVPSLARPSGDVPAPVDFVEMDGPGQSHNNDSSSRGLMGTKVTRRSWGLPRLLLRSSTTARTKSIIRRGRSIQHEEASRRLPPHVGLQAI